MVDHRDKWAITYKKSSAWLSAQINNKVVEKELLEAARIFVVKRYQVDEETLRLDESFKSSLTITEDTVSEEVKKKLEKVTEEEAIVVEVSERQAIGILKIKIDRAKELQSGGWFQTNDPYVIVFDATAKEVARTKIAPSTNNPVWEEVHYVSVYGPNDKITLKIFDDNLFVSDTYLGFYVLNAGELIVKSKKGKYESGKELDKWEKVNRVDGKGTKGEIHIAAHFSEPLWYLPITSFSARITQTFVIFTRLFHGNSLTALLNLRTTWLASSISNLNGN
jgi:hypothetical protein